MMATAGKAADMDQGLVNPNKMEEKRCVVMSKLYVLLVMIEAACSDCDDSPLIYGCLVNTAHSVKLFEDVITKTVDYCLFDVVVEFHREIKKLFEQVYFVCVSCELCHGSHLLKDFPNKEQIKEDDETKQVSLNEELKKEASISKVVAAPYRPPIPFTS
nr:hypothetical protein [Tanacetum cinerariifolium]